jgi:hypothetical protein
MASEEPLAGIMDMTSQVEEREAAAVPAHQAQARQGTADRRRPGRIENISPHLIPLLRQPTVVVEPAPVLTVDDLRLPKGIAIGVLLAIPLWGLIIGGIMMMVR